ncbi:proline-specific peptidase [Rhodofomes roseus]|uniref:Proline-specific peptidase n=1 Tax=Rhodofomes roseus TaxID=34475 RepID=A0ABQ8KB92_9APHY|nr:proline-specific peptidase [Rhodofomes roseus]KAH9834542.1 proline-specific peptidase [Rhodofomes roseus]
MTEHMGTIPFTYGSETFHTWYKIGSRTTTCSRTSQSHGIPVVFYDQIGIGASAHPTGRPAHPGFWNMELFMDELDNLLARLGVHDDFDLLGHSWGCMLAVQYASSRHPEGMRHLVLADGSPSMELWARGTDALRVQLPVQVQATLKEHELHGTTDSQEYQDAVMVFYKKHVCNMDPWPKELLQSFEAMDKDPTVYSTMIGPSDIHIVGTLRTWSCVDQLHNSPCPTLLVNSPMDEAQDVNFVPMFEKINCVKWVQFVGSTHLAFYEEPERYFAESSSFLREE